MEKIKIGQIGVCHEHASGKINTLKILPDVYEIVGIVDDRESTAAKFAGSDLKPYEGLKWMTEDELFAVDGLQAVCVETPNGDLVTTALRCMERGLAMHMDKPGGELHDFENFKKLLDGCKAKSVPFQMGYMFRNNPAMQFSQKIIREGGLGEIFEIQLSMSHDYGGEEYQTYLSQFSGGIMFNLGCHLIDFVVSLMGRPAAITPFLKSAPGYDDAIKNNCLTILEYPNATVTLRACSKEVGGLSNRRCKICGTKGTIEFCPLERFDGNSLTLDLRLHEDYDGYAAGNHTIGLGVKRDRYQAQLLELASIIRGEMDNPYTYEHDALVQEVVLAASGYTKWKG